MGETAKEKIRFEESLTVEELTPELVASIEKEVKKVTKEAKGKGLDAVTEKGSKLMDALESQGSDIVKAFEVLAGEKLQGIDFFPAGCMVVPIRKATGHCYDLFAPVVVANYGDSRAISAFASNKVFAIGNDLPTRASAVRLADDAEIKEYFDRVRVSIGAAKEADTDLKTGNAVRDVFPEIFPGKVEEKKKIQVNAEKVEAFLESLQ